MIWRAVIEGDMRELDVELKDGHGLEGRNYKHACRHVRA